MAERVVERVDESLKADIMHWAAIYVGHTFTRKNNSRMTLPCIGGSHAHREQEDLSPRSLGR